MHSLSEKNNQEQKLLGQYPSAVMNFVYLPPTPPIQAICAIYLDLNNTTLNGTSDFPFIILHSPIILFVTATDLHVHMSVLSI